MPTYDMKNPEGVEHEVLCSIADMEKKKEEGWTMVFKPPKNNLIGHTCLLYTSPSPRDGLLSRMPSSA